MSITLVNEKYYEIVDSESPSSYSFNNEVSSSVITFLIPATSLFDFIKDVLGYSTLVNNSYIRRPIIPMSHPSWPWQYAYSIENLRGVSADGAESSQVNQDISAYKDIQTEKPDFTGAYKYWHVTVKFVSRNYNVYMDDQLNPHIRLNQDYFIPNKNAQGDWEETPETWVDRFEYSRFTNWKYTPEIEQLSYGSGNFWYKRGAGVEETPISNENGGSNFLKIVKSNISFNWFQVPFEFCVNNSLWVDCYSKLNSEDFCGFPKGTLLLSTIDVKKYPPTYPFENIDLPSTANVYDYYVQFYKNQYADVTFNFSYINYPESVKFQQDPAKQAFLKCKDPNSFHNRLIYPSNGIWYYVESAPAKAVYDIDGEIIGYTANPKAAPTYWSIPMGLLFNYKEGV